MLKRTVITVGGGSWLAGVEGGRLKRHYLFDCPKPFQVAAQAYALAAIRDAPAGTIFFERTIAIRNSDEATWLETVQQMRYDGLLLFADEKVIGHIWFQMIGTECHGFEFFTKEEYRRRGLAERNVEQLFEDAIWTRNVTKIHLGGGTSPEMDSLVTRVRNNFQIYGDQVRWETDCPWVASISQ